MDEVRVRYISMISISSRKYMKFLCLQCGSAHTELISVPLQSLFVKGGTSPFDLVLYPIWQFAELP